MPKKMKDGRKYLTVDSSGRISLKSVLGGDVEDAVGVLASVDLDGIIMLEPVWAHTEPSNVGVKTVKRGPNSESSWPEEGNE